jgi:hypothetical protein
MEEVAGLGGEVSGLRNQVDSQGAMMSMYALRFRSTNCVSGYADEAS